MGDASGTVISQHKDTLSPYKDKDLRQQSLHLDDSEIPE